MEYTFLIITLAIAILTLIVISVRFYILKKAKAETEQKYAELELKVHTLELESIKNKLNPHLFKNTLNSIQSHAYQTYYALDKLANVLDYILYESDKQLVSLKEEIEFAKNLVEINKVKISPLFEVRIKEKINEHSLLYEQKLIAPLITVDLIENAFKHADLQSPDAFISIVFELKNDIFYLTVSNKVSPKQAIKKEKSGIGIENYKKRLDIIYKDRFKLDRFVENDIYIAHLKINLLEYKTQMHTAG